MDLANVDVGLMGFLALGAGAVLLISYQCLAMCRSVLSDEPDPKAAEAAGEPPVAAVSASKLPRPSSREKVQKLAQQAHSDVDIEAGPQVPFKGSRSGSKPKVPAKLAAGERPLKTPLMKEARASKEGCLSP